MNYHQPSVYSPTFEQAIDRSPETVSPDTTLIQVLELMNKNQNKSNISLIESNLDSAKKELYITPIFIVQEPKYNRKLLGQFSPQEIINLIETNLLNPQDNKWHNLPVSQVMSPAEITLTDSPEQDILTVLTLLYQHRMRLLPLVDDQGYLTGAISRYRFRQILQPSNILKMRRVAEFMNIPITANSHTSLLTIAEMMIEHQSSHVIITQHREIVKSNYQNNHTSTIRHSFHTPMAVISADDIVQATFVGINLAKVSAEMIMTKKLFLISPNDSLWTVHKKMERQLVSRLLVVGDEGELLGIVTENLLLQALDPAAIFGVVKKLQQSVYKLQAEKVELLRTRNVELEKQVKERTAELEEQLQRDRLLAKITFRIHHSLNLQEILQAAVDEVREYLGTDRVIIYRLELTGIGVVIAESVTTSNLSLLGSTLSEQDINRYLNNIQPNIIYCYPTLQQSQSDEDLQDIFEELNIKALAIVPILLDGHIWGMMSATNCYYVKKWQLGEINLLEQLASQIAIAIQQSLLYEQVQNINICLEKQVQERTIELEQKIQELKQLNQLKDDFLSIVSHELRTPLTNMKMAIHNMIKIDPKPEQRQRYLSILESHCTKEIELINDLLDVQRLEAGAYIINFESVNLVTLLSTIIEAFQSRTQERGQILKINYPQNLRMINSNRQVLTRILTELLNNACKYTSNGGEIHLLVEDLLPNFQQNQIVFTVSNQSEIPQLALNRIFEKFYRIPNADPWKQGGTGLGLALVQKLVEQLLAKIEVKSHNGWTHFTLTLNL